MRLRGRGTRGGLCCVLCCCWGVGLQRGGWGWGLEAGAGARMGGGERGGQGVAEALLLQCACATCLPRGLLTAKPHAQLPL